MIALATFDLELISEPQSVYVPGSAIVRHLQHLCLHGRDYIRITYEHRQPDNLLEHQYLVLSDGHSSDIAGIRYVGAVSVNHAAWLLYRAPVNNYYICRDGWAGMESNMSVSQEIHHMTIT